MGLNDNHSGLKFMIKSKSKCVSIAYVLKTVKTIQQIQTKTSHTTVPFRRENLNADKLYFAKIFN